MFIPFPKVELQTHFQCSYGKWQTDYEDERKVYSNFAILCLLQYFPIHQKTKNPRVGKNHISEYSLAFTCDFIIAELYLTPLTIVVSSENRCFITTNVQFSAGVKLVSHLHLSAHNHQQALKKKKKSPITQPGSTAMSCFP